MTLADAVYAAHLRATDALKDQAAQSPSRFISITRARCIARYKMTSIAGRPEELQQRVSGATDRVISFGYAGGELRIRKHGGENNRQWVDHVDIRLVDGWLDMVYEFLDEWVGYVPADKRPIIGEPIQDCRSEHGEGHVDCPKCWPRSPRNYGPRPIKDNPQA